jgi:hypothetical protein
MISKLQELIENIKNKIDDLAADIITLDSQPSIVNIVYDSNVDSKVVTVTLDKQRVNLLPLLLIDINTGNTQDSSQAWSGNLCTITTTADVITPFMIVIQ